MYQYEDTSPNTPVTASIAEEDRAGLEAEDRAEHAASAQAGAAGRPLASLIHFHQTIHFTHCFLKLNYAMRRSR